jgi:hypothetical protein
VPGRNLSEAIREYIEPLQQSLSCFTRGILRPSGYAVDQLLLATFSGSRGVRLRTRDSKDLYLGFVQHFSVSSHFLSRYKVTTRASYYKLEDQYGHEIFAFHWHPEAENDTVPFAHMHLGHGSADRLRDELYGIHFPSSRMAFEEFGILLLDHSR